MRNLNRVEVVCITLIVMWTEYLAFDLIQWNARVEIAQRLERMIRPQPQANRL